MKRLVVKFVEEVESELDEISKIEIGTEKHKTSVDTVVKLVDRVIELDKLEKERHDRLDKEEYEREAKEIQLKKEAKERYIVYLRDFVGVVLPIGAYIWATKKSWDKEEGLTMTYSAGKRAQDALMKLPGIRNLF